MYVVGIVIKEGVDEVGGIMHRGWLLNVFVVWERKEVLNEEEDVILLRVKVIEGDSGWDGGWVGKRFEHVKVNMFWRMEYFISAVEVVK